MIGSLLLAALSIGARRRAVVQSPPSLSVVDVAGSPDRSPGSDDGAAGAARFSSPRGIAYDPTSSSIILADTGNHRIRRIANGQVTTLAADARFRNPHGLAVDGTGRIWICDTGNHTIRRIERDGSVVTVAGAAGVDGSSDGSPLAARFRFPEGITIESESSVLVADTGNHALRRITSAAVTTVATATPLRYPSGIVVDPAANVWVADRGNDAVRRISTTGAETIFTGFRAPAAVTFSSDSIYVADSCHQSIRRISGETLAEGFLFPYGLAAGNGELLIADTRHHVIRALRGLR